MRRRDFLGVAGYLFLLGSGCAGIHQLENPKLKSIRAGNLYFHVSTDFLNKSELEKVFGRNGLVRGNFRSADIEFDNVITLRGREFPELNSLDLLLYVLDESTIDQTKYFVGDDGTSITGEALGHFGVGCCFEGGSEDSARIRLKINPPYSQELSQANTGYIVPGNVTSDYFSEDYLLKYPELRTLTRKQVLTMVSQLATHEVGHGLGAIHTDYANKIGNYIKVEEDGEFMGSMTPLKQQSFCLKNQELMHRFITAIKADRKFESPDERFNLRMDWNRYYK